MMTIDEEQDPLETMHAPGTFPYTKERTGTRHVMLGLPTLVDSSDPKDVEKAHAGRMARTGTSIRTN
jgi:hypothetical protein